MHNLRRKYLHHLDKKLRFRLRLYFIISIIMIGVVSFEVLTGKVNLTFALIGLLFGACIGIIAARTYLISWHKDAKKVISRLDFFGMAILVLYIILSIFRGRIIGQFVQGTQITGTSFAVIAGVMIGRVFGTGREIVRILREQNLFI